jgi:putative flavoprotein involved in K+ transport
VANYLEEYARRFRLPVQSGMSVDRLWKQGGRFQISSGHRRFESENVVVAMSNYQVPRVPAFAHQLSSGIVQLHSYQYRNPSQLQEGGVLVVGVGNSGADIGIEVARTHPTWISGKESGHIPGRIENLVQRKLVVSLLTFTGHHLLTVKTSIGRKLRPRLLHQAGPLIRVKPRDLIHAGIQRVGRTVGVKDGLPLLEGGLVLDVKNVIWCTGYQHGFSWIDLPVLGEASNDEPIHQQGIVKDLPRLYFVGLHFLYALSSATLLGVGRDAERIARAIASRSESESNRVPEATTRIAEGKKQAHVPIPSGEIMMR